MVNLGKRTFFRIFVRPWDFCRDVFTVSYTSFSLTAFLALMLVSHCFCCLFRFTRFSQDVRGRDCGSETNFDQPKSIYTYILQQRKNDETRRQKYITGKVLVVLSHLSSPVNDRIYTTWMMSLRNTTRTKRVGPRR
jgi:hypothetical protein